MEPVAKPMPTLLELTAKVGVALLSALICAFGAWLGLTSNEGDWWGFLGLPAAAALSVALFWSRRWVAVAPAVLMALTLAVIPLVNTSSRDPIRAEAEQMLGSIKGQVRVAVGKQGHARDLRTLTGPVGAGGCGVSTAELQGRFFRVRDQVIVTETGAILYADPMPGHEDRGTCTVTFNWSGGDGVFTWSP